MIISLKNSTLSSYTLV